MGSTGFRAPLTLDVRHRTMTYRSRIPTDSDYVRALGTALYNFTYLEWIAICTVAKLRKKGVSTIETKKGADAISKDLLRAINNSSLKLTPPSRTRLLKFRESFRRSIRDRNKLLHAHPHTAEGGLQQLIAGDISWSVEAVNEVALRFENAAIEGSDIFHGSLMKDAKDDV